MTFAELEQRLPNGFHDARILELSANFTAGVLRMVLSLQLGGPDDAEPERRSVAVLTISPILLLALDPPDPLPMSGGGVGPLAASGEVVVSPTNATIRAALEALSRHATYCQFFLNDWNCFLHVAGSNVALEWKNGEP
jgi:hypothetical protein